MKYLGFNLVIENLLISTTGKATPETFAAKLVSIS